MRFLFSKQSPRFNYSLSKCLLKTLIFFFLLFSCMAHIESVCCCCLVSGAFIKRTDVENCKHRLYPNNIFSLRFSSWSFFLLNNNIGGCIQHTSGLFPKSLGAGGGGSLHTEGPLLYLPEKRVCRQLSFTLWPGGAEKHILWGRGGDR